MPDLILEAEYVNFIHEIHIKKKTGNRLPSCVTVLGGGQRFRSSHLVIRSLDRISAFFVIFSLKTFKRLL